MSAATIQMTSPDVMRQNFDFVIRCINSCTNKWQLRIAADMIERFHGLYDSLELHGQLLDVIINKQSQISAEL